jgi:two-component system response regulator HydG
MKAASKLRSRILIVDDDAEMRDALGMFFERDGHECELAADGHTALEMVAREPFDAVVSDVRMAGMNGLELLARLRRTHPALPFVAITAVGRIGDAVEAIKGGAFQYVTKPLDLEELRAIVASAIEEPRRQTFLADVRRSAPTPPSARADVEILGKSARMRFLQTCIDQVATSSAPVLITGETGVGKELVARAIHARGPRRAYPFVAVNTAALPAELLEGEIFGHVRGAFTGAIQSRRGLMTEADGGTLLLDEIGDMPLAMQAKLLRVLQFGEVRPLGSERTHAVDVRVIASTHRDLTALVREGRFREDLYYRLNVLPVAVPPLRDRREDIPDLVAHFVAEARLRAPQSPVRGVSAETLQTLTRASWPGNVRELASAIERAVVFGAHATAPPEGPPCESSSEPAVPWSFANESPWTLRRLSRTYTVWVLAQTGGNKERAADILGVDLSTLYRWQRRADD